MTPQDFSRFSDWFDVLAVTHRLQASDEMRGKMKAEYFDVLSSYPVDAVADSYQSLRRKMKKWPVPADWLENLPPFGSVGRLPALTPDEVRQNDEAEKLGYERENYCHCAICVREDATHLKSRYVPQLDREGNVIERRHPSRMGRPILLGRWIHGNELKRWYAARAKFYELKAVIGAKLHTPSQGPVDRARGLVKLANIQLLNDQAPRPEELE